MKHCMQGFIYIEENVWGGEGGGMYLEIVQYEALCDFWRVWLTALC